MSITQRALEDLADLVKFAVRRVAPGSQYFILESACNTFGGMEYGRDRAFMHLLWVARDQGHSVETVKGAVRWGPEIMKLADGSHIYADVSHDASVDAMVARYWKRPSVA